MNTLVVYDTKYGNTEIVAKAIADELQAMVDVKLANVKKLSKRDTEALDILIVGSPTQAWNPTKAVKSFLKSLKSDSLSGIKAAAFDTELQSNLAGSASRIIERTLKRKGCIIVAPAAGFIVSGIEGPLIEGETERAKYWVRHILEEVKSLGR